MSRILQFGLCSKFSKDRMWKVTQRIPTASNFVHTGSQIANNFLLQNCKSCRGLQVLHSAKSRTTYDASRSIHVDRSNFAPALLDGLRKLKLIVKLPKSEQRFLLKEIKSTNKVLNKVLSTSSKRGNQSSGNQNEGNQSGGDDPKGNKPDKLPFLPRVFFWAWLGFAVYTTLQVFQTSAPENQHFVSWLEFVHDMLAKGEVEEIIIRPEVELAIIRLVPGAIVKGHRVDGSTFTMKIHDPDRFEDKLRKTEAELGIRPERGIHVSYHRQNNWMAVAYAGLIGFAIFMVFRSLASKVQLPNPSDMFASERKAKFVRVDLETADGKGVTFKDVAGLREAKIEVMEFVDYLKSPDRFKKLGAKTPRGALLLGPPGCGKTLLAKALATEARVPFLATAGPEFVEMLGGLGAARVRDLFKEARRKAPCIVYIDEIDAIGRRRGGRGPDGGNSEEEHTLNQLLVEMDGMGTQEGVIVIGATNRADVLDKALLRPGRFDRHVLIDLPTLIERQELFAMYLSQLKTDLDAEKEALRLGELAPGMSGADINNVCNEAALHAARNGATSVREPDFDYAIERVVAGAAKRSQSLSIVEKKVVAYHESGHALVGWLLPGTDALLKISIIPRTNAALGFAQYLPSDQKLYSKEELFERMCMALGGRVAESLTFNRVTTGAQDDLSRVTKLAYAQIRQYGMSDVMGLLSFDEADTQAFGSKPYSRRLQATIDEEARAMVAKAYTVTEGLLKTHADKLKLLSETLLKQEVLSYEQVQDLIGPPPHGPKKTISPSPDPFIKQNSRSGSNPGQAESG